MATTPTYIYNIHTYRHRIQRSQNELHNIQSGPNKSLGIGLEEKRLGNSKIHNFLTAITILT